MDSEFAELLNALKRLGIPYTTNHNLTKEKWQKIILEQGYNLTAFACSTLTSGNVDWLFANTSVGWTKDEEAVGPGGLLLFGRDTKTDKILKRRVNNRNGDGFREVYNLDAIKAEYSHFPWHTCMQVSA
jgi:hypothetical protein